jgi:hypothetical protein
LASKKPEIPAASVQVLVATKFAFAAQYVSPMPNRQTGPFLLLT